jgi:hypothetical protein
MRTSLSVLRFCRFDEYRHLVIDVPKGDQDQCSGHDSRQYWSGGESQGGEAMTTTAPVEQYKVYFWSPATANRLQYSITIETFFSRRKTGVINFYPEAVNKHFQDRVYSQSSGPLIHLEFHENQYPAVIDLLRNESVEIYITARAGTPGSFTDGDGSIRSAKEPGGEGETS